MKSAKRKLAAMVLTAILTLAAVTPVTAVASTEDIRVFIDGVQVNFVQQSPVIVDGRTLVPVRYVFEQLGFDVGWNDEAREVILDCGDYHVVIPIDSAVFTVNGVSHSLDVPAQILPTGRTVLPIRAIAENVGYYVVWDAAARIVHISSTPMEEPAAVDTTPIPTAPQDISRDGVLTFGGSGWAGWFNPIMATNIYDQYVNHLVFEGLVWNNMAGEPIPMLATRWEISNNNRTYTFFLDPRATFSNGRPLTAHDVSFTHHTMAHPLYDGPRTGHVWDLVGFDAFNSGCADHIEGIRVIDDHTIEFTHVVASPQHIWNFGFGILCREHYAFDTWDQFLAQTLNPLGSGQFMLADIVFQGDEFERIVLERNDNHRNADRINLAGIVMHNVWAGVLEISTGGIDIAMLQAHTDALDATRAADNLWYNLFVANTLRHITFNTTREHLSDHRVRQALAYAFNTEAYIIAETGSPDLRSVGNSPFSPVSWAFPGTDALNNYDFNMERAHQLMDEAGWLMADNGFRYKNGERFRIHWLIYPEAAWPSIISDMAYHSWGELGVETDIEMHDFATVQWLASIPPAGEGQFDVFQMGWSMAIDPDLRGGLWDATQTGEGAFFSSGFTHPRLMELIELGATTMNQVERTRIYHEIAQITNYYLPVWVLSNGTQLWVFNERVNNLEVGPFLTWPNAIVQQGTWVE